MIVFAPSFGAGMEPLPSSGIRHACADRNHRDGDEDVVLAVGAIGEADAVDELVHQGAKLLRSGARRPFVNARPGGSGLGQAIMTPQRLAFPAIVQSCRRALNANDLRAVRPGHLHSDIALRSLELLSSSLLSVLSGPQRNKIQQELPDRTAWQPS
jgi:hypothetical protein